MPESAIGTAVAPPETPAASSPGVFERMGKWFGGLVDPGQRTIRVEPAPPPKPEAVAPPPPPPPPPPAPPSPELMAARLGVGQSLVLGQPAPPAVEPACFTKVAGSGLRFCSLPVEWPAAVEPHFRVDTLLYRDIKAIVMFEQNRAVHLYTLFPTASFGAIVAHHTRLLGTPTISTTRQVAMAGRPAAEAETAIWRQPARDGHPGAILEIRAIDDVRPGFPDTKHGMLRVYREGSQDIFRFISPLDFLTRR